MDIRDSFRGTIRRFDVIGFGITLAVLAGIYSNRLADAETRVQRLELRGESSEKHFQRIEFILARLAEHEHVRIEAPL